MNHFDLDENKEYTFPNLSRIISRALTGMTIAQEDVMGEDSINITFSAKELEAMIIDVIDLINNSVPGTFKLVETEKGFYRTQYTAEGMLN